MLNKQLILVSFVSILCFLFLFGCASETQHKEVTLNENNILGADVKTSSPTNLGEDKNSELATTQDQTNVAQSKLIVASQAILAQYEADCSSEQGDFKDACYQQAGADTNYLPFCSKAGLLNGFCFYQLAERAIDESICDKIFFSEDLGFYGGNPEVEAQNVTVKMNCYKNIAKLKSDVSICDNILNVSESEASAKEYRFYCINYVNTK